MENFAQENFHISNIRLCMLVRTNNAKLFHEDRPTHGLVLLKSGATLYRFASGEQLRVEAGDLFYLPKFSTYRVLPIVEGECVAINFELTDEEKTYSPFLLRAGRTEGYSALFKRAFTSWERRENGYLNACFAALYEIVYRLGKDVEREYLSPKCRRLASDAREAFAARLADPDLSVDGVARSLCVSPEYLRRVFKEAYGVSPKRYILERRIEKAKALLTSREFSVGRVRELCGYEDDGYFSREFKRLTGRTPSEYGK